MQLFFGVIVYLLAFVLVIAIVALQFIRRGIQKFRRAMTGDLDDEETFRRMADKHYRGKDDPEFDKDYFKGRSSSRGSQGQERTAQRTTTTTAEGVTIIDDRTQAERKKIFEKDEGEYVDYQEVE